MATTSEEVWQLLGELISAQKETEQLLKQQAQETDRRFQETEQLLKQQAQETDRRMQESDRRFQETEHQIQELGEEIERVSKEIGRVNKEVNKQISALGGKWGRFIENMVAPACETLFVDRGISVHGVSQRRRRRLNGDTLEVDVLVENESYIVVVEVKSSLGIEDIKEFLADLPKFKQFFPEYNDKQLYGAVAGIEIEDSADIYAYRQGLFVLAQSGETMKLLNSNEFQPRVW